MPRLNMSMHEKYDSQNSNMSSQHTHSLKNTTHNIKIHSTHIPHQPTVQKLTNMQFTQQYITNQHTPCFYLECCIFHFLIKTDDQLIKNESRR